MLKKVAFTMYPIRNVARARRFYEETLGLTAGLNDNKGDQWWIEYDLPGGGCIALTATSVTPTKVGAHASLREDNGEV